MLSIFKALSESPRFGPSNEAPLVRWRLQSGWPGCLTHFLSRGAFGFCVTPFGNNLVGAVSLVVSVSVDVHIRE